MIPTQAPNSNLSIWNSNDNLEVSVDIKHNWPRVKKLLNASLLQVAGITFGA